MTGKMQSEIRIASAEDLPAMEALEKESFSDPWPHSAFESELKGDAPSVVAIRGDRLVGFLCRMVGPQEMHVTNIAVRLEFRRQGIGGRLLAYVIELARASDCEWVYLDVRPSNSAALGLYEKYGFKEIFRRRKYYTKPPEDGLVLALQISGTTGVDEESQYPSIDPERTHN